MDQLFYKVVNRELRSVSGALSCGTSLTYKLKHFTYPVIENSKLFVFDTLEHARCFTSAYRIYSCIAINPKPIDHIAMPYQTAKYYKSWWKFSRNESPAPFGTYVCDAVKLIKRVL